MIWAEGLTSGIRHLVVGAVESEFDGGVDEDEMRIGGGSEGLAGREAAGREILPRLFFSITAAASAICRWRVGSGTPLTCYNFGHVRA